MTGTAVPLGGGNVSSGVVRVVDTVRRPVGPWTPAVHALLTRLRDAGFRGAPRVSGARAVAHASACRPATSASAAAAACRAAASGASGPDPKVPSSSSAA